MAAPKKVIKRRRELKKIDKGQVHIQSTFNNTIVTVTDMNGNEVDLGIADLMATEITFTMPDYDLYVEAMYQKDEPADDNNGLGGIFGDLDLGDLTEGDSESKLVNIINNIIALFRNIIEKITGFFRAIGDAT